MPWFHGFKLGN